MKKIYLDPGHGGASVGAAYKGRKEQDDCLKLCLKVRDFLLTQKDIEVKMSRTTDVNPKISDRCAEANKWGASYFCSMHRNANKPNTGTGVEIWVYSKVKKDGLTYKMAETILKKLCAATGYKNRGVKLGAVNYTDYGVNSQTKMSSCLIEVGFIDNDKDNEIFDKKFNEMAKAIAVGICEANDIKWVDAAPVDDSKMYIVQAGAFKHRDKAQERVKELEKAGFEAFVDEKDITN